MAQQQDPSAQYRNTEGAKGIAAGSQDTYRSPGFRSPNVSTTGNSVSAITTAPAATPAAPATVSWGKYSGPSTPGIAAAMGAGGSGQPGQPNSQSFGQAAKNSLLDPTTPFGPLGSMLGLNGLFGKGPNNSQLQDIGGALYQGLPISDADWARAGYTPGGAALLQPGTSGLRSITAAPVVGGMLGGPGAAAAASRYQQQQQPVNTVPPNAVLRY